MIGVRIITSNSVPRTELWIGQDFGRHVWMPRDQAVNRLRAPDGYTPCVHCGKPFPESIATGEFDEPCFALSAKIVNIGEPCGAPPAPARPTLDKVAVYAPN